MNFCSLAFWWKNECQWPSTAPANNKIDSYTQKFSFALSPSTNNLNKNIRHQHQAYLLTLMCPMHVHHSLDQQYYLDVALSMLMSGAIRVLPSNPLSMVTFTLSCTYTRLRVRRDNQERSSTNYSYPNRGPCYHICSYFSPTRTINCG